MPWKGPNLYLRRASRVMDRPREEQLSPPIDEQRAAVVGHPLLVGELAGGVGAGQDEEEEEEKEACERPRYCGLRRRCHGSSPQEDDARLMAEVGRAPPSLRKRGERRRYGCTHSGRGGGPRSLKRGKGGGRRGRRGRLGLRGPRGGPGKGGEANSFRLISTTPAYTARRLHGDVVAWKEADAALRCMATASALTTKKEINLAFYREPNERGMRTTAASSFASTLLCFWIMDLCSGNPNPNPSFRSLRDTSAAANIHLLLFRRQEGSPVLPVPDSARFAERLASRVMDRQISLASCVFRYAGSQIGEKQSSTYIL
ncbi:hypothetical protein B296_00007449 [Ensete ventricosum]|uniref:Uncharacterized protein n=1 Tax=Ensete ventricosum TaxID=4639 RepID=A0A427B312_ENSVE|nr:hypothetical protein B296_00007449 [Ensete ventricosum]